MQKIFKGPKNQSVSYTARKKYPIAPPSPQQRPHCHQGLAWTLQWVLDARTSVTGAPNSWKPPLLPSLGNGFCVATASFSCYTTLLFFQTQLGVQLGQLPAPKLQVRRTKQVSGPVSGRTYDMGNFPS